MNIWRLSILFEKTVVQQDSSNLVSTRITRSMSRKQKEIGAPDTCCSEIMIAKTNLRQCDVEQAIERTIDTASTCRLEVAKTEPKKNDVVRNEKTVRLTRSMSMSRSKTYASCSSNQHSVQYSRKRKIEEAKPARSLRPRKQ